MAVFPQYWWKDHPLIFAHRGANLVAPENTMSAFLKAELIGAAGIELDVRLTADDIPIVIHNSTVDKTTNGHGSVYDLTLRDVEELDAGSWFDPSYSNEKIPTLEQVFDTLGDKILMNIELKENHANDEILAQKVCKLVEEKAMEENVWFSSFSKKLLRLTRQYLPEVPNGYLFTVRSPVTRIRLFALPVEAVHPHYNGISEGYVTRMHNLEKRVAAWTVDDIEVAQKCIDAGVDVIITNNPEKLLQILT
jgi:glycerophosphoryl diester phosphodiesterase